MNNPCELDPRDRLLQRHAPAIMVPRHGVLALPHKPGHRFLVASDGMWLEVLRPWLHARVHLGHSEMPLPFGDVGQILTYAFTETDVQAIERRFLQDARPAGFGIVGMRERVEVLGGTFDVQSAPGKGTTVRASLPIAAAVRERE